VLPIATPSFYSSSPRASTVRSMLRQAVKLSRTGSECVTIWTVSRKKLSLASPLLLITLRAGKAVFTVDGPHVVTAQLCKFRQGVRWMQESGVLFIYPFNLNQKQSFSWSYSQFVDNGIIFERLYLFQVCMIVQSLGR